MSHLSIRYCLISRLFSCLSCCLCNVLGHRQGEKS